MLLCLNMLHWLQGLHGHPACWHSQHILQDCCAKCPQQISISSSGGIFGNLGCFRGDCFCVGCLHVDCFVGLLIGVAVGNLGSFNVLCRCWTMWSKPVMSSHRSLPGITSRSICTRITCKLASATMHLCCHHRLPAFSTAMLALCRLQCCSQVHCFADGAALHLLRRRRCMIACWHSSFGLGGWPNQQSWPSCDDQ